MSNRTTRATGLLIKSAMTGALGGLLFGFDTAVIAGITHALATQYALSSGQLGFTVAIALYGTVLGALISGPLGQRIGSRAALRIMGLCYVISALGCALSPGWLPFLMFRFVGGFGIGGSSVLGPVYIAELAPAKWRGRLVGLFQINVVAGILLAYLSNAIIAHCSFGAIQWRVQIGVSVLPALLFLTLLFAVPHSSRWLVSQNRIEEAQLVLAKMGSPDSNQEVETIRISLLSEEGASQQRLFSARHLKPIFLAITIALFNQFSGINAILYYANDIFSYAGFSGMSSDLQTVAIGAANLLATLLGISIIDKLGRRTLLLIGAVGDFFALAGVWWVFHTHTHYKLLLPFLVGFIIFFAISQGSVIWVYLSEVFPTNVRAKGQGLGASTHWIADGAIANAFPFIVAHTTQAAPFGFFALMMAVQFFVVLAFYPETKGKTLEEMQTVIGHG